MAGARQIFIKEVANERIPGLPQMSRLEPRAHGSNRAHVQLGCVRKVRSWLEGHLPDTSENRASSRNPREQRADTEKTREESGDCSLGLREGPEGPRRVSFREHSGTSMERSRE